jgi:hypothetical protein
MAFSAGGRQPLCSAQANASGNSGSTTTDAANGGRGSSNVGALV